MQIDMLVLDGMGPQLAREGTEAVVRAIAKELEYGVEYWRWSLLSMPTSNT